MANPKRPKKKPNRLTALQSALLTMFALSGITVGSAILTRYPGILNFRFVSGSQTVEIKLDGRQVPQSDKQLTGQ
jgi:hypothetical protein